MRARLIEARDEDAIVELGRVGVAELSPHLGFSEDRARWWFRRSLHTARPTTFVAEHDNGDVVGILVALICDYFFADGFFVSQELIYVRPDKRGTRAAAELYRLFSVWAEHCGAREAFGGVANGRTPDRTERFMKKFGFSRAGYLLRRIQGEQHAPAIAAE